MDSLSVRINGDFPAAQGKSDMWGAGGRIGAVKLKCTKSTVISFKFNL